MKKLFLFLISAIIISSCVKQEFDAPPGESTPIDIKANKTIKDLKAIHGTGAFETITEDWIIEGVVVANDESGNYYKTIVIQDATGGIELKLNANGLYSSFPVGRKVYVKCNGLALGDYAGLIQLGGGVFRNNSGLDQLAGIEELLIPNYVIKGALNQDVTPTEVTLAELDDSKISTLVTIKKLEFASYPANTTFATTTPTKKSKSLTIQDCNGLSVVLYSSGFSNFADAAIPTGNGTITGILGVFSGTKQIIIRQKSDIEFNDVRCDGSNGNGGTGGQKLISITDLIAGFKAGTTNVASGTAIKGTVISDRTNKNINAQNLVLQGDDNRGIVVRFSSAHSFNLGDLLEINIGGGIVSQYQGSLQVTTSVSSATKKGQNTITPKKMTLAEFNDNFDNLESTLVQIENATASTTSKFSGSITLTDATGKKATLYTYSTATFANDALPNDVVNVVGVASRFNTTLQIQARSASDVTKGSGGSTGGNETEKSIGEVRDVFKGTTTTAPANTFIKGIVISDKDSKNINGQNLVLQGADGRGILVRFGATHSFALGDELKIVVSNQELSSYNELLQLNKVPLGNATKTGTGTVTAKEVTIQQLSDNFEQYESTLVKIKNATFPAAAKYGGTIKLNDGTGEIDLFTATGAVFANAVPPVGAKTVTAIVSQFKAATTTGNGYQIQIRSEKDVE